MGQGDLTTRDAFAEEHDIRLKDAAAGCARRHSEPREVQVVHVGIAVGQGGCIEFGPGGVQADQLILEVGAPDGGRACHAADEVETPVQVHHRPAPGGLMQPVHVLG